MPRYACFLRGVNLGSRRQRALHELVGPWTMRTEGTIDLLCTKFFG